MQAVVSGQPPLDEGEISEIDEALQEPFTTRFFAQTARHPDWPGWLNQRKLLDALFEQSGQDLNERDRETLHDLWEQHLKPHLDSIAIPALTLAVRLLEQIHNHLALWDREDRGGGYFNYRRLSIEARENDRSHDAIDVVIDAARDSLEWLAAHQPERARAWREILIDSEAPMLRRLAVHTLFMEP